MKLIQVYIVNNNLESIGKMNMWIINDMIEREVFESVIKPESIKKAMCLIVVDLSRVNINILILAMGNNR
jgi:hypothetical protein